MSQNNRGYATVLHLSALAGYFFPFGSVIAPLVMWLLKKDEDRFVDRTGRAVLNFQISVMIYFVLCIPLWFILIGIPMMFALWIFGLVATIIGAVKANDGLVWKYPLAIPFLGDVSKYAGVSCRQCGYDLTGNVTGRCPECGAGG